MIAHPASTVVQRHVKAVKVLSVQGWCQTKLTIAKIYHKNIAVMPSRPRGIAIMLCTGTLGKSSQTGSTNSDNGIYYPREVRQGVQSRSQVLHFKTNLNSRYT